LDRLRVAMGSANFSAQYQQSPIPKGGHMINWDWFRKFDLRQAIALDEIIISWDTAMKATELSDYSVGTVWGIQGELYYLLDLIRVRMDYPNLKRKIIEIKKQYFEATLLIEDAGSGTGLIQDLREIGISAVGIRPVGDKIFRMSQHSARIEAGAVLIPAQAPWLDELRTEILAFPYGSHDDQVDSISQALAWISRPHPKLFFA
jgi:predicted phage terminase large subunit-like protein